ncbi:hypothetical protein BCF33_1531 [Hasllibacter halocynthiae]|uniref:DUF1989 domain-containing protein n=1 Tax=Hasllibacter halocynthiae TaxID=595589 RepID=A0A2T0X155_9RHOB|nr:DUF1989 domain-containing protein [Hasllibacter halocynthiae]PRY92678.1 hypothetical protein BCF33_1531 [Hasllibacter halocynthiae]
MTEPARSRTPPPPDAALRRAAPAVPVYTAGTLASPGIAAYRAAIAAAKPAEAVAVPPREARALRVPAGQGFRITCIEGPQVGDLNLFSTDWSEQFWSGKTRALHGTHLSTGDRLWSSLPTLRPMATIVEDSLDWYGFDEDGCSVHDVIGTRCDPYTANLLSGGQYHHCCHSNLTRAIMAEGFHRDMAEGLVHDVLNVFMATGFDAEGRYVMKASPVRPGDHIAFLAEIDLVAVLSTCPGGDCGQGHSSDAAACHPLLLERLKGAAPAGWAPPPRNGYDRSHGQMTS